MLSVNMKEALSQELGLTLSNEDEHDRHNAPHLLLNAGDLEWGYSQ